MDFLKLYNSYFDKEKNKAVNISELNIPETLNEKEKIKFRDNKRLAYIDTIDVNWCEELGTVLANEEVIGGLSERGGYPVIRRPMKQWVMRITEYADRLLDDLDNLDFEANHIICFLEKNIIGYSRIIDKKANIIIGRIIVEKKYRKKGIGEKLVKKSIRTAKRKIGKKTIIISAQKQWDSFYKKLNFKCTGKEYLEDGIPHQEMFYFE